MLNLTAGGLSGGYKTYLQNILPLLRAHHSVSDLLVVVPPGYEGLHNRDTNTRAFRTGEHWRGFSSLKKDVRAWKPDVVFVPTQRYLNCNAPCVSMVRNMEPMMRSTVSDGITRWGKHRAGALLARQAVRRATRVIAVSEFVRNFLVEQWNVSANRVGVVYHGVKAAIASGDSPSNMVPPSQRFLFAAGSLLPYRGVEDAIRALQFVHAPVNLAIAGEGSAEYVTFLKSLAQQSGVTDRVIWLGNLPEHAMTWAYRTCVAFLMTSRVEACPNTALEAMANGCVCISTTSLPMPEFFQVNASYYSAGDTHELAQQIMLAHALTPEQRLRQANGARQRATDFTWERTANNTIAELQLALTQ